MTSFPDFSNIKYDKKDNIISDAKLRNSDPNRKFTNKYNKKGLLVKKTATVVTNSKTNPDYTIDSFKYKKITVPASYAELVKKQQYLLLNIAYEGYAMDPPNEWGFIGLCYSE